MNILTFELRCHVADMSAILKLSFDTFMCSEASINAYFNIITVQPPTAQMGEKHVDFAFLNNVHRMYSSAFYFMTLEFTSTRTSTNEHV